MLMMVMMKKEGGEEGGGRREEELTLKSNNPNLTGGELGKTSESNEN